jgi:hypothetical protein
LKEIEGSQNNNPWFVFDAARDFGRMGLGIENMNWRISNLNEDYQVGEKP